MMRVDKNIWPTRMRAATVSTEEIEKIHRVGKIIRLGRINYIENSSIIFKNGDNIPTYNSVQDITTSNMNGSCNLAFVGSNNELDKNHTSNISKSDSNSAPKHHHSSRWRPFTRFNRTLAINE